MCGVIMTIFWHTAVKYLKERMLFPNLQYVAIWVTGGAGCCEDKMR